ncbi:VWA domain-containing protein [Celerinatantimonas yamalensis]|uniref:VWA domain-containing protein n=1 Tax=Celerinatantimonas yamalensis TaxID=559956 RepID=A0ABW9G1P2_9GAMM
MNFTLAWWPLLCLVPLPWLIQRFFKRPESPIAPLINTSLPYVESDQALTARPRIKWLAWLVWLLLLIAAARPQWLDQATTPIIRQGRNMMVAVDLSGSMLIPDMQWKSKPVSRLVALRHLLGQFVENRRGDRIGLILFADHAYLQAPLTFDTTTVHHYVVQMTQGLVGNKTAIGEAIGLGVKELMSLPAKQRVLILLTDGQNTAGVVQPMAAAQVAKANHVRIYTIGIGAKSFEQPTIFGLQRVNPSQDLDETLLRKIAKMTGGEYFRAANSKQMASIYKQLDQLEPIKGPKQYYRPKHELYVWPLALSIILMLAAPMITRLSLSWRRS